MSFVYEDKEDVPLATKMQTKRYFFLCAILTRWSPRTSRPTLPYIHQTIAPTWIVQPAAYDLPEQVVPPYLTITPRVICSVGGRWYSRTSLTTLSYNNPPRDLFSRWQMISPNKSTHPSYNNPPPDMFSRRQMISPNNLTHPILQ